MAVVYGAVDKHLRVGIDTTVSPATVTASTTSVTVTFAVYVQTVSWWYNDNQTVTLTGAVSASKDYKLSQTTSGTYTVLVGSWSKTVPLTSAAQDVSLLAKLSNVADGAAPQAVGQAHVPARPSNPVETPPVTTTQPPATTPPSTGTGATPPVTTTPGSGTTTPDPGTGTTTPPVTTPPDPTPTPNPGTGTTPRPDVPVIPDTSTGAVRDTGTASGRMQLAPSSGVLMWSSGRYDAFPYLASAPDGRTLAVWRSATAHDVDRRATTMAATSTDGGVTYTDIFTAFDDQSPTDESAPAGLAWDAVGKRWIMVLTWRNYVSSTSHTVAERWTTVHASSDGRTWTQIGGRLPTPGAWWFYANDVTVDGSRWLLTGYGQFEGGADWVPLTMVSSDAGASWSKPVAPTGLPTARFAEPRITKTSAGQWLMLVRQGTNAIAQCRSIDGVSWWYERVSIGGMTGNPDVCLTADGALITLLRQPPTIDDYHGLWAWAWSADDGATWTTRTDFPGEGRFNVYGSLAAQPDGTVACVYASEDDPSAPGDAASIYWMRFVAQRLTLHTSWLANGVPSVDITAEDRMRVARVSIDPVTGDEIVEEVRVRTIDGMTSRDFELQQGRTVTYRAAGKETEAVTGPVLPHTMLIHPVDPGLSCKIHIVTDGTRSHDLDAQTTSIPSSVWPVVTKSGPRKKPAGETRIRTHTLLDADRLERLLEDGLPLFWSHHPGLRMPDWIQPLDLSEERFVQTCSHTVDDADDVGQWRDWTLKWQRVPRPSATGLPVRKRIRDYQQAIASLTAPIEEL